MLLELTKDKGFAFGALFLFALKVVYWPYQVIPALTFLYYSLTLVLFYRKYMADRQSKLFKFIEKFWIVLNH